MPTFLVSGLWHGANWTFVIWGGLNGVFQVIGNMMKPWKEGLKKICRQQDGSTGLKVFNILVTFVQMTVAWTFFKAHTFADACLAVRKMMVPTGSLYTPNTATLLYCLVGICFVVVSDILEEKTGHHPMLDNRSVIVRFTSYVLIVMLILTIGVFDGGQFIYFKF